MIVLLMNVNCQGIVVIIHAGIYANSVVFAGIAQLCSSSPDDNQCKGSIALGPHSHSIPLVYI